MIPQLFGLTPGHAIPVKDVAVFKYFEPLSLSFPSRCFIPWYG